MRTDFDPDFLRKPEGTRANEILRSCVHVYVQQLLHLCSLASARDGTSKVKEPPLWARLPGQDCKIPNVHHALLPVGKKGASVLRFSSDGK